MTVPLLTHTEQQKRAAMQRRDVCLFDDKPCSCDQNKPCILFDHDVDLPGPMPLALVFARDVQHLLLVIILALFVFVGFTLVQNAREIDRQIAMEDRV